MKRLMHWIIVAILICGTSVFTACSVKDDPVGPVTDASKLVMITKHGHVDYWKQVEATFRDFCKEKGVKPLYYTTSDENAYQEQVAVIKELANLKDTKLAGIIYAPSFGLKGETADDEVYAFAKERGIPVVIIDTKVKTTSPLADCPYVGIDQAAAGKALAAEVTDSKVAAFLLKNTPGFERAEAFEISKPGTTIFMVEDNATANVKPIINDYDSFVFFNGSILNNVLPLLKEKGKKVYTFDVYESFLDELIAGNLYFQGIMAQNTFAMVRKAAEAALAGVNEGEIVPPFFISKDNLSAPSVKPFLEFYGK